MGSKRVILDANGGLTAGLVEALIQSHEGYIEFLPALPKEWPEGHFKGFCTRGGFEIELHWKNKQWNKAVVYSRNGNPCRIWNQGKSITVTQDNKKINILKNTDDVNEFKTRAGKTYIIS